jgi:capsular polysaccharide biosynthesis protein
MMELTRVLRAYLRWWWLILIPAGLVSLVAVPDLLQNEQAGAGGYQASFRYTAAQRASNIPEREGDYQDVWLASEFVVNAFTDWVSSSSFRAEIADRLPERVATAPGSLTIAADNNRSIGVVYLSHPDADSLGQIAQAALDVLQTENAVYFPHLGDEPAEVNILDAPQVVPAPPPLTNRFAPILQMGVALLFGVGLATLAIYLDPTLRYPDELEQDGLQVMAVVPRHD